MDDIREHAPVMTRDSLISQYPQVYGRKQRGRYTYRVYWLTGNESWSCALVTPIRSDAERLFRKFTNGQAYWEMRDTLTDQLLGEHGRNNHLLATVADIWQRAIHATGYARYGNRYIARKQALIEQARAIAIACVVPPEV